MILYYFMCALYILLCIYEGIILISIIMSWIPNAYNTKVGNAIYQISNWYMKPFRGWLVLGVIDFTPVIGLGIYQFILQFLMQFII